MQLYNYLFAGMIIYILLGIGTFNKQTPGLNSRDTIKQYLNLNKWNLIAGLVFGIVCISLLTVGKLEFLKSMGFNVYSYPESAFVLGLLNQWGLKTIRQFFRTGIIETNYDKIKTTE